MNLSEAVKELEKGNKIVCKESKEALFITRAYLNMEVKVMDLSGRSRNLDIVDFDKNWTIAKYETLTDCKKYPYNFECDTLGYSEADVKKYVKQFIKIVNDIYVDDGEIQKIAKEIFGDDIVGE